MEIAFQHLKKPQNYLYYTAIKSITELIALPNVKQTPVRDPHLNSTPKKGGENGNGKRLFWSQVVF